MELDKTDRQLIAVLSKGLPLVPKPYEAVAQRLGTDEADVVARIQRLEAEGALSRFGVIVRHKEIGYSANAMVVWDFDDKDVGDIGRQFAAEDCVTLCYRRPRRDGWPFNLFTMIHGTSRDETLARLDEMTRRLGLRDVPRDILFSTRRFKQMGARYGDAQPETQEAAAS